jgi:hypothetical protein
VPRGAVVTIWSLHEDWRQARVPSAHSAPQLLPRPQPPKRPGAVYARLRARGEIGDYTIDRASLECMPTEAGETAIVRMDVQAQDWRGIVQACKDNYDPEVTLEFGDASLVEHFGRLVGRSVEFGRSHAQLLVLDHVPVADGGEGGDFDPASAIDPALLRQLLFKDVDISYRPGYSPVSFPADINAPVGTLVAVWASNTVVAGYGERLTNRIDDMIRVVAQVAAAKEACAWLIERAQGQIPDRSAEPVADPKLLSERAAVLFDLQWRYTRAVEAQLPNVAAVGGRPL